MVSEGSQGLVDSGRVQRTFETVGMGITDRRDSGTFEMANVGNVLSSHHSRSDDSVTESCPTVFEAAIVMHHAVSVSGVHEATDSLPLPLARVVAGRSVGPIGFGCWRLTTASTEEAAGLVEGAVDLGCTLIDTADVYGLDWGGSGWGSCEERLGSVLAARPGLRDRIVLVTKGGIDPGVPYNSSSVALTSACEASLRRLGVDHVDLYMVHRPDLLSHPSEVATTLRSLRERGLIGAIGVSNYTAAQVEALERYLGEPVAAIQPEFSVSALGAMRNGVLDRAMHDQAAVLAWSPLAGGRVATGEQLRHELIDVLDRIAAEHETDRIAVALAFVLAHPSSPIALLGTQRLERVAAAMRALDISLTRSEWFAIVEASEGVPLP
jgi:predicted oxidoreductase